LASRDVVRVEVKSRVGLPPMRFPEPVSIQLAMLYVHVMRDRLGESATLDTARRTLVVSAGRVPRSASAREILASNVQEALNRAADARTASGKDTLAHWFVDWAQWLGTLGVNFGSRPGDDTLDWALAQSSDTLKARLGARVQTLIDKVSATPIQLP